MKISEGGASVPPGRSALIVIAATASLLTAPLAAEPSYAGIDCGGSFPIPGDDCTAPDTVLTVQPDPETSQKAAGFEFTTFEAEARVTFACRLDGPSQAHDWADCTDPALPMATTSTGSTAYTGLGVGRYTFQVRATDAFPLGANTEDPPVLYSWDVVEADPGTDPDADAPDTTITAGPGRWHLQPFADIEYTGDEQLVGAECRIDGEQRRCTRSQAVIPSMGPGDHTFGAAGIDTEGNVDPTPAVSRWTLPYQVRALILAGPWKEKRGNGYFQGSFAVTRKKGATAHMSRPSYRSVALVATRCPGCGRVEVSMGSRVLARIDLDAPAVRKRKAFPLGSWARSRSSRVTVEVLTQGKDVIVEGMGFSKRR